MPQQRERLQVTPYDVDWAGVSYASLSNEYRAPKVFDRQGKHFDADLWGGLGWAEFAPAYVTASRSQSAGQDLSQSIVIVTHDPVKLVVTFELILESNESLTEAAPGPQGGFMTVMPLEDAQRIGQDAARAADWWALKPIPTTKYALIAFGNYD